MQAVGFLQTGVFPQGHLSEEDRGPPGGTSRGGSMAHSAKLRKSGGQPGVVPGVRRWRSGQAPGRGDETAPFPGAPSEVPSLHTGTKTGSSSWKRNGRAPAGQSGHAQVTAGALRGVAGPPRSCFCLGPTPPSRPTWGPLVPQSPMITASGRPVPLTGCLTEVLRARGLCQAIKGLSVWSSPRNKSQFTDEPPDLRPR